MCGRFACSLCSADLASKLKESNVPTTSFVDQEKFFPSFNVAPRKYIPVVRQHHGELILQSMQWGFIPSWTKQTPNKQPINARGETLVEGPSMFDGAKNKKRCIVVAEGFYEWRTLSDGKNKTPYYTKRRDGQLMLFAGLYDVSHLQDTELFTCTIITTTASSLFSFLHDRMPVILENKLDAVQTWLDLSLPWSDTFARMLRPYEGDLVYYPVTDRVGSVRNNSPDFIVPVDQLKGSISHFFQKTKPSISHAPSAKDDAFIKPSTDHGIKREKEETDEKVRKKAKAKKGSSQKMITRFFPSTAP